MQRKLTALADGGNEQSKRSNQDDRGIRFTRQRPCGNAANGKPRQTQVCGGPIVGGEEQHADAHEQANVSCAHGEEGLECGTAVGAIFPPMTNQHEGTQTHDFPTKQEQNHVFGNNHCQHAR